MKKLDKSIPILMFGTGQFSEKISHILLKEGYQIEGFLQTHRTKERFLDLPIYEISGFQRFGQYQVVIGIFNRDTSYKSILSQLPDIENVYLPWEIYTQFGDKLGWSYWLSPRELIIDNKKRIDRVRDALSDEHSRYCLDRICKFRIGLDLDYSDHIDQENQYFNEITLEKLRDRKINYIDAGAYDGDSFLDLSRYIELENSYLFEPGRANYDLLLENVKGSKYRSICFPLGVADENKVISFNHDSGESNSILKAAADIAYAVSLDDLFSNTKIDLIKMDVEGAENQAIAGAKNIIRNQRPILAISLYHKPEDIFELPEQILDIDNNYDLFIRQHQYNSFDSVLYGVPKS